MKGVGNTSVKHTLVECRKFAATCCNYFNNPTLSNILGDICSVAKTIAFLHELIIFAEILTGIDFKSDITCKKCTHMDLSKTLNA